MVKARKRFGQHFLESAWVTKLVKALNAQPEDAFVEIGPGRGAITRPLAAQVARLLAIEVDRDLAAELVAEQLPTLTVVQGDVLETELGEAVRAWQGHPLDAEHRVRVVGNLPYNISSPIMFMLLKLAATTGGLTDATLMLQREVADRLTAKPGTKEYGVLSILTGLHADVTRILALPPGAFRPPPTGLVRRGPAGVPAAAGHADGRGALHADGPDDVHPAPQDAEQRPEAVRHRAGRRSRDRAGGGWHRRPASAGDPAAC